MPVLRCQKDGKSGFKWGPNGVCFTSGKDGKSPRERALSVGRAIAAERARRMGKDQKIGDDSLGGLLVSVEAQRPPLLGLTVELLQGMGTNDLNQLHSRLHQIWDQLGDKESAQIDEGRVTKEDVFDSHLLLEIEFEDRNDPLPNDDEISVKGPEISRIVLAFVGDGPGVDNELGGLALVEELLEGWGVSLNKVVLANVYDTREESVTEYDVIERGHALVEYLDGMEGLKVIVAMSKIAALALTGENESIEHLRGETLATPGGTTVLATYHPAILQKTDDVHYLEEFTYDVETSLHLSGLRKTGAQAVQDWLAEKLVEAKDVVLVPGYVNLVGSATSKDNREIRDVDILVRENENMPEGWADSVWLLTRKLLDPTKDGLNIHLLANAQGPHIAEGEGYFPLFDLVLRPRKEIELVTKQAQGIQFVIGRLKGETTTTVQAVLFDKEKWTVAKAKTWLKDHDFKSGDLDETEDKLRFRQRDPGDFKEGSFRTIDAGERRGEGKGLKKLIEGTIIESDGVVFPEEGESQEENLKSAAPQTGENVVVREEDTEKQFDPEVILAYESHLKEHGWDPDSSVPNITPISGNDVSFLYRVADGWGEWYFLRSEEGVRWVAQKMPDVQAFDVAGDLDGDLTKETVGEIGWGNKAWDKVLTGLLINEVTKLDVPPGEEGGTRSAAAAKFWRENWQESFPKSGKGKFVYHHHWKGLSEVEKDFSEEQLLETDGSVHGDLRFDFGDALWGFTVFIGKAADNKDGDQLVNLPQEMALQGAFKLYQPRQWLDVGEQSPLIVYPGGVGSTAKAFSKFFVEDSGTYEIGVWNQSSFEVFFTGKKLNGRFTMRFASGGGKRVWLITKEKSQTPFAQENDLEEQVKDQRSKRRKFIVWGEPGQKLQKINVKEHDVEKRLPINARGWTVRESFDQLESLGRLFTQDEAKYVQPSPDSDKTCGACRFYLRNSDGGPLGRCQLVEGEIAWFGTSDLYIAASAEAAAAFAVEPDDEVQQGSDRVVRRGAIVKASKDGRFVLAPVLVPEEEDLEGDVISSDEIERAAHDYMANFQNVGLMHERVLQSKDVVMVESYIARDGHTIGGHKIKKGTWLGAFRVINERLRAAIREGKLTGVSIGGVGTRTPIE